MPVDDPLEREEPDEPNTGVLDVLEGTSCPFASHFERLTHLRISVSPQMHSASSSCPVQAKHGLLCFLLVGRLSGGELGQEAVGAKGGEWQDESEQRVFEFTEPAEEIPDDIRQRQLHSST